MAGRRPIGRREGDQNGLLRLRQRGDHAGRGGAGLRPRQRLHVRRRRLRDAAHVRRPAVPPRPPPRAACAPRRRASASRSPPGDDALRRATSTPCWRARRNPESYIRIIVTPGRRRHLLSLRPRQGPDRRHGREARTQPFPTQHYRDGVPVIVSSVRRNHPARPRPGHQVAATCINNILAVREAQARGAVGADHAERARARWRRARARTSSSCKGARCVTPPLERGHPARRDPGARARAGGGLGHPGARGVDRG